MKITECRKPLGKCQYLDKKLQGLYATGPYYCVKARQLIRDLGRCPIKSDGSDDRGGVQVNGNQT